MTAASVAYRILFLQAPLGRPEPLVYPLGIVTLAGAIPAPHTIRIIDPNYTGVEKTARQIREFTPDIICLSIRNLDSQIRRDLFYYYLYLKDFIKILRSCAPDAKIIAGGAGFSLFPEKIMADNPALDLGVFLEADRLLPELLDTLDDASRVKGVYYREKNSLRFSGVPELPAPEQFGRPRYDLLDPFPYKTAGGIGVQTKRGCPLHCIYCTYPHLNGSRLRSLPVEQVVSELKILKEDYHIDTITFVDGVFNIPKKRTETLLHAMMDADLGITWRAWFTEKGFDREFAELCRDAGCPEFSFSPDGFSPETLKQLGKTITMEDIGRIFQIARDVPGIRVAFNFFWNPPGQTPAAWLRMLWFTVKCKLILRNKVGGIIFGNPRIEPHTPLMKTALQENIISNDTILLPETADELKKTFYSNPSTRCLDWFYTVYEHMWKIKKYFLKKKA
jgi:anaerobic magnesium-protoporphyrin IX monomethyl ester cyclase